MRGEREKEREGGRGEKRTARRSFWLSIFCFRVSFSFVVYPVFLRLFSSHTFPFSILLAFNDLDG